MVKQTFIDAVSPFAIEEQMKTGVLASITMAQAVLESGWGRSAPGNNLFGIKAFGSEPSRTQITKECYNGTWTTIEAKFRVYDDLGGSIRDHSKFLTDNPRYRNAGFFEAAEKLDYKGCAKALQKAGYATDPNYATLLCNLIDSNQFYQFDQEAKQMLDSIKQLQEQVAELSTYLHQPKIPDWAKEAVDAAVKAGIIQNPDNGSVDFYRLLTILHRKGMI